MNSTKIGKIINFDGYYGEIISNDNLEKYFFLVDDIEGEIDSNTLIQFRGEKIQGMNRAFFVKQYMITENKELTDITKIKKYIKDDNLWVLY